VKIKENDNIYFICTLNVFFFFVKFTFD